MWYILIRSARYWYWRCHSFVITFILITTFALIFVTSFMFGHKVCDTKNNWKSDKRLSTMEKVISPVSCDRIKISQYYSYQTWQMIMTSAQEPLRRYLPIFWRILDLLLDVDIVTYLKIFIWYKVLGAFCMKICVR